MEPETHENVEKIPFFAENLEKIPFLAEKLVRANKSPQQPPPYPPTHEVGVMHHVTPVSLLAEREHIIVVTIASLSRIG